ncbi:MAG: hypothetical protein ABI318_21615 [Chthoniobacteraceae bacterium]
MAREFQHACEIGLSLFDASSHAGRLERCSLLVNDRAPLTFAEAARRGIICRCKVVVAVVTSGMVNAHVLRHGEVIVKDDAVKARPLLSP